MRQGRLSAAVIAILCVILGTQALRAQFSGGGTSGVQSVNGCTGNCNFPANLGSKTVATLPACDGTAVLYGSVAYVTDLGGGANNVKCVAGAWQHFNLGAPSTVTQTSGTYTVTPLSTPSILMMTGNILSSLSVTISTTNLYPGYTLYVMRPGILTGTLTVGVSGTGSTLPILGSSRSAFVWDGTTLQQIQ